MKWIWIILAIVYLLSPFDIIPGLHPVGWLDDIIVAFFLFRYLSKFLRTGQAGPGPNEGHQNTRQQSDPRGEPSSDVENRTPYDILGIQTNADQKQIQQAYRKLANQYHPDKVSHLGEEFQKLAEKRFKEIQEAYDALRIHK